MIEDQVVEPSPCGTCGKALSDQHERGTCARCVGRARADLHAIVNAYALLGDVIANPMGSNAPRRRNDSGHTKASSYPMPGGDALVLAAGGGTGLGQLQRVARMEKLGLPTDEEPEFGEDDRDGDPPSVAHELGRWEDEFRRHRGQPSALTGHYVASAAAYLLAQCGWAGGNYPAFDEFATDLRRLRNALERATGTDEPVERSGAPCTSCAAPAPRLERRYGPNGLDEDWSCPRCRKTYTPDDHMDAVRASARLQLLAIEQETPA